jgi:hypothetical protein
VHRCLTPAPQSRGRPGTGSSVLRTDQPTGVMMTCGRT